MNRATVLTVLMSLLVVLAGCSGAGVSDDGANGGNGNGNSDSGGNGNDAGGNGDSGGNGDAGSSGNGDAGDGSGDASGGTDGLDPGEMNFFEFDRPGRYVFDVEMAGEGSGQVTWDIQSVDGDQLTVYVKYAVGGQSYESTVSGTKSDIQGQLIMSPAGSFAMLGIFSPMFGYYDGQQLAVGEQWSYSTDQGSMSFAITGTDNYAGVDCYTSEIRLNDSVMHEACFSPDLGLAAYTAWYEEDTGNVEMRMELVEFQRN